MNTKSVHRVAQAPHHSLVKVVSDILDANKGSVVLSVLEEEVRRRIPDFSLQNYSPVPSSFEEVLCRIKAFTVHTPENGVPALVWTTYKKARTYRKKAVKKKTVLKKESE